VKTNRSGGRRGGITIGRLHLSSSLCVVLLCMGAIGGLTLQGTGAQTIECNLGMIYANKGLSGGPDITSSLSRAERLVKHTACAGWSDSRRTARLALLAVAREDWAVADQQISRAISHPKELDSNLALAAAVQLLRRKGDLKRWYALFERVHIPDPNWSLSGYLAAAKEFEADGRLDEAEATYRRAIEVVPASPKAFDALASFLEYYRHDIPGAISQLEAAVALDPTPEHIIGLAARYGYAGRFAEGMDLLSQVQIQFPGYDESLAFERARIALERGDPAQALRILEVACRGFPNSARLWDLQAQAYEALGRPEEALRAARQAIAVDPGYTWAYLVAARALSKQGQLAEAEAYLQKLSVLGQGDRMEVLALIGLGDVYVLMGRNDLARQSFCKAQTLNRWREQEQYINQQISALGECSAR
jgi:tetratricopeptide (TPR) repeat protein